MLEKTTTPGYSRDKNSGAILNENVGEYEMIKARRRARREELDLRARVERLEALVAELMRVR